MTFTYLVEGADPVLRDRAVQRLVDELLEGADRTLALEDVTIPSPRATTDDPSDGQDGDGGSGDGGGGDGGGGDARPQLGLIRNALQSPPFMTDYRVVVVRDVAHLLADEAAWLAQWVADPLDTARLVLVAGGSGRLAAALSKACKAHAEVVRPPQEKTRDVLDATAAEVGVRITPDAAQRVAEHLGEDAGRVPELVALLESTYGKSATIDLTAVEPYLGDTGTVGPFELTNAIDRGDVPGALATLHRMLHATSARSPKPVHPFQVMAMLAAHYRRLLRLDDPAIRTKEDAARALGAKSAAGARFPLDAARALGTDGLREAVRLLARAELDLRGEGGLDDVTTIELLVARLAALSRRRRPARARRGA